MRRVSDGCSEDEGEHSAVAPGTPELLPVDGFSPSGGRRSESAEGSPPIGARPETPPPARACAPKRAAGEAEAGGGGAAKRSQDMVDISGSDEGGQQTPATIDQFIDFTIGMSVDETSAAAPPPLYQQQHVVAANVIRRLERGADSDSDLDQHPDSNEYLDLRVRSLSRSPPPADLRLKSSGGGADLPEGADAHSFSAVNNFHQPLFYSSFHRAPGHSPAVDGTVIFKQEDLKENHHDHEVAASHSAPPSHHSAEQEVSEYLEIRRENSNFLVYKDLSNKPTALTSLAPLTPANQQHHGDDAAPHDNNNGDHYQHELIPRAHQFQESSVATLEPASWWEKQNFIIFTLFLFVQSLSLMIYVCIVVCGAGFI